MIVLITGGSGCGKSTVLKLLMCMYPLDSGERYIRLPDREDRFLKFLDPVRFPFGELREHPFRMTDPRLDAGDPDVHDLETEGLVLAHPFRPERRFKAGKRGF